MKISKSSPSSNINPNNFRIGLAVSIAVHCVLIAGVLLYPEETLKLQSSSSTMKISLANVQILKEETPPAPQVETPPPPPPPVQPPKPKPKPKPKPTFDPKPPLPQEPEPIAQELKSADEVATEQSTPPPPMSASTSGSILPQGSEELADNQRDRELLERIYAAILKYKNYPRQALRMKMQGETRLEFGLKDNGELSWVKVVKGSGYTLLDNHAMEVIKKASKDFPAPDRHIRIQVPMNYELL